MAEISCLNIVLQREIENAFQNSPPSFEAKIDVLLVRSNAVADAAKKATAVIPIVMISSINPEAQGLVASLARPGGNVTGLVSLSSGLTAKRLEILKEVIPKARQ
jgi:putative ABC transport system substrate-binding protein